MVFYCSSEIKMASSGLLRSNQTFYCTIFSIDIIITLQNKFQTIILLFISWNVIALCKKVELIESIPTIDLFIATFLYIYIYNMVGTS